MGITLLVIWIILTVLFIFLGRFFWKEAQRSIPPFQVPERAGASTGSVEILGAPVDQPLEVFVDRFNKYIDDQNNSSRNILRATAYSSYLASATSLISVLIQISDLA